MCEAFLQPHVWPADLIAPSELYIKVIVTILYMYLYSSLQSVTTFMSAVM